MRRISVLFGLILVSVAAEATITFVGFGAPPVVAVRIGQPAGIATIDFNVPANAVGSGTPVAGTPSVFVGALARHPFAFPFPVFTLTVDSSTPMSNGAETINFTEIQWVSTEADIPSGSFNGSNGQVILGPIIAAFSVTDTHTFVYANSAVIAAGTYVGRVTYTAALP